MAGKPKTPRPPAPAPQTEARISSMDERRISAFALRATRYAMAQYFGQTTAYEGARQYYKVLGYSEGEISVEDCYQRYNRQDIAGAVVDLPAMDTWRKPPLVSEQGRTDTEFAKAWKQLTEQRELGVWAKLTRADRISGIGRYGGLLLGINDNQELDKPVQKPEGENGSTGLKKLLYLRPFSEATVKIKQVEKDAKNPRFGKPLIYSFAFEDKDGNLTPVHYTRVLHIADGKTESDVYGTPRLQRVFNRLDDMIKIVGGSAEATWLGMRPGTLLTPREGYEMPDPDDTAAQQKIEEEIENYTHDVLRFLMLEGMEAKQLGPSEVVDVSDAFEVVLSLIAAASRIPKRILEGSAKGELAAAKEDMRQWAGEIRTRQETYAEPEILRPFIDMLIEYSILPRPANGYTIGELGADKNWHWPSIIEMDEQQKAEIAKAKAEAIAALSDELKQYPMTDDEKREIIGLAAREMVTQKGMASNAVNMAWNKVAIGELSPKEFAEYVIDTIKDMETLKGV